MILAPPSEISRIVQGAVNAPSPCTSKPVMNVRFRGALDSNGPLRPFPRSWPRAFECVLSMRHAPCPAGRIDATADLMRLNPTEFFCDLVGRKRSGEKIALNLVTAVNAQE